MRKHERLIVIVCTAVGVFLLLRWWKLHKARVVASGSDSPLSQAVDAIAPSSAPPPGGVGPAIAIDLPQIPVSTEIAPAVTLGNTGFFPPKVALQGTYGSDGSTPPIFNPRQVVLA